MCIFFSVRGLEFSSPDHTVGYQGLLGGSSPKPVNIPIDESHAPTRARGRGLPLEAVVHRRRRGYHRRSLRLAVCCAGQAEESRAQAGAAQQQQNKTRTPDAANRQTNGDGEADNTVVATTSTTNAATSDSAYGTNQPGMMGGGMYGSPYGMGVYGSPYGMGGLGYGGMGMGMLGDRRSCRWTVIWTQQLFVWISERGV